MENIKTVKLLVEAGKASAGPPLGPALGQMKLNVSKVVEEINNKTKSFLGMKIPVTLYVNMKTREYEIEVGLPTTSALLKKEISESGKEKNVELKKVIKIAKEKMGDMFVSDLKAAVKTVLGVAVSMGVKVDGKSPKKVIKEINEGLHDSLLELV